MNFQSIVVGSEFRSIEEENVYFLLHEIYCDSDFFIIGNSEQLDGKSVSVRIYVI